jgi:L-ribulose-5-phosphate 4-epimerase
VKILKSEVLKAALFISKTNLVAGTWGNVSLKRGDLVYITPSGIPYDELKAEDIATVDLKTLEQIDGKKASSELPLHIEIYRDHPSVNAVVHFHSIYASAFASMRKPIPCYVEDQAQIIGGDVEVAEYAPPGSWALAENASKTLGEKFGVLLANHGAVAVGRSMKEALTAAQIVEKSAKIAFIVGESGIRLPDEDVKNLRDLYLKSYSKGILDSHDSSHK